MKGWTCCRWFGVMLITGLFACKKEPSTGALWTGSNVATFLFEQGDSLRAIRLFYYVPKEAHESTPVVFVFHGVDRNAMQYRNALESRAANQNFILVAPEFSESNFPGSNPFQLGNVFVNGEAPTPGTLNPEEEWTFSIFPDLFQFVVDRTPSQVSNFHLLGHSAGGQFLHRLLLFKPNLPVARAVISAAGWYTLPTDTLDYPYGLGLAPVSVQNQRQFLETPITIQVGASDNDPNAPFLRRNVLADQQGTNRLERAIFFHSFAQSRAGALQSSFNWRLEVVPNLNHNYSPAIQVGADLLFKP
jgi:poly(3-hydroxybutyrate) depolymerase